MLKGECIHPGLLRSLSLCGHGDKVLIADGNYPLDSMSGQAEKIYLGVSPGLPKVTDVLGAILSLCEVEKVELMRPEEGRPEIFREFAAMLPGVPAEELGRNEFYAACGDPRVRMAVSTGEERTFANILLTVGVA